MHRFIYVVLLNLLLLNTLEGAVFDDLVEEIEKRQSPKRVTHRKHHKKTVKHHIPVHLSSEAKWQYVLRLLGYYKGPLDGDLYSQRTFKAISAYHQATYGIANGFLEPEDKHHFQRIYNQLYLKRFLDIAPKRGVYHPQTLQAALKIEGYYKGKIDGKFGRGSKSALNAYKKAKKLQGIPKVQIERKVVQEAKEHMNQRLEKVVKASQPKPSV